MDLKGKTAVVSGGAEGIGFAIAQVMGQQGMNVVLADINAEQLQIAEQSLQQQGIAVLAVALDAADIAQWERLAEQTLQHFGKVHMLVNNAGVTGRAAPIGATDLDDWRWVLDVNLMGVVNGAQTMIPLMKQHGEGGWLINVASMAGFGGLPLASAYSASKAAVVAVSECWHGELQADGIHVSVLSPGFVKTRINQSERNKQAHYQNDTAAVPADTSGLGDYMQQVIDAGLAPTLVGERVLEALAAQELYIFTHPNYAPMVQKRSAAIAAAFESAKASPLLASVLDEKIPEFG
jgi:NAD(P)-dependent dehydrogenase (short-subunit alcohol dehydrogenase family)